MSVAQQQNLPIDLPCSSSGPARLPGARRARRSTTPSMVLPFGPLVSGAAALPNSGPDVPASPVPPPVAHPAAVLPRPSTAAESSVAHFLPSRRLSTTQQEQLLGLLSERLGLPQRGRILERTAGQGRLRLTVDERGIELVRQGDAAAADLLEQLREVARDFGLNEWE
jgi:hypothetical protein